MGFFSSHKTVDTDKVKITKLLSRGVEDMFVKESLEKKLSSGKSLRVKLGFDPTGSKIHIGRAIVLRKLKAFQDLGHTVVFIVGDFTAEIGDPSDKLEKRPMLSSDKIKENLKDYKNQVGKIINLKEAEFHFNSSWLSKLGFAEIATLAESFSISQMLARRNFKDRLDKNEEISVREMLYPLMQGYDSVAVKADIEIGGFDQLFNLKAGRTIQKHYGMAEQDVLTTMMLEGTDGRKMSTSWGNVINITDNPNDMFGKVMSLKDELVEKYFLLCTDIEESDIKNIISQYASDPKSLKMRLAKEIVSLYHGKDFADSAEQNFIDTFSKGEMPKDTPIVKTKSGTSLVDVLIQSSLISSKTEWRRLVDEGAVFDMKVGERVQDYYITVNSPLDIRVGKRRFIKIVVE